jgi:Zn-dependent alcohol dehydrogenase
VAYADVTLEKIPEALSFEQAIFVGDIFSTGFHAAHEGDIKVGDVVAVVGAGPVGLFAQVSAQLFGPATVLAIDSVPERLALAEKLGLPREHGARMRWPASALLAAAAQAGCWKRWPAGSIKDIPLRAGRRRHLGGSP